MSATESKEIDTPAWSQGPGASLRAAREARQLDVDKLAVQLHLSRAMVEAIERDDYEVLPGSVFVRGYLKNYARLVGLSVSHILQAYESRRPEETITTPVVKKSIRSEVSSGHTGVRLVTWGIILLLVALVVVWWRGYIDWGSIAPTLGSDRAPPAEVPAFDLPPERFGAAPPVSEAAGAPEGVESFTPPAEETPTPSPVVPPEEASPSPAPRQPEALSAPQASQSVATTATPPVAETEPDGWVVLQFSAPCWVDVRDSSGRFKISAEARKGEKRVLEGTPPWSVVLGNSRAASITVGGRAFDHSRYVTGNVARFTLKPDAS